MKKSLLLICIAICIVSCHTQYESINPVNQWVKTTSYPSQKASNVVFLLDTLIIADTSSATTFYTGIVDGTSWTKINSTLGHIAPLVTYGGALYCGTTNAGVYYSNDFCRTWVQKNNGLPNNFNVADLVATDVGLYVCGQGLYYSHDNGNTWTDISIAGTTQVLSVVYLDHTLIASTNAGLYNSGDNGKTWAVMNSSSGISTASISEFAVFDNAIYAASGIVANSALYASYDKGNTWIKGNGLDALGANSFRSFAFYDETLYVASTHGVFESSDNGRNWIYTGCDNALSLLLKGSALYSGTASQGLWEALLKTQ